MGQLIAETKQKARKEYRCMACDFVREGGIKHLAELCTFAEKRHLIAARNNNYRIRKGDMYLRQFCVGDGSTYTFIAILEIHAICLKYEWYPED